MNFAPLTLELLLAGLILIVFVVDLVSKNPKVLAGITFVGLTILFFLNLLHPWYGTTFQGTFVSNSFTGFLKGVFLLAGILVSLGSLSTAEEQYRGRVGEYYILLLFSLLGMLFVVSARDLVLFFVAFELMSIPLYILAAYQKDSEASIEAGLKLFIFGTFSSAILVMGLALLYGTTGSTRFDVLAQTLTEGEALSVLGFLLFLTGIGFKVAMVPFHMWVPDTYAGAPAPFVAFLSVAPKAAGFAILFIFFLQVFANLALPWKLVIAFLSGITMILGNLLAIPQTHLKRLLGYSGIAHIGYMLLGVAAGTDLAIAMVLFYFVAYVLANIGAFLFAETALQNEGTDQLSALHGYAQRNPLLGLYMLIFLLSLGGIPFVVGFWAKLYVFLAALKAGYGLLVFLAAVLTVVALYYYLNVARQIYIEKPASNDPVRVPASIHFVLIISTLGTVLLGLYPKLIVGPALEIARAFVAGL